MIKGCGLEPSGNKFQRPPAGAACQTARVAFLQTRPKPVARTRAHNQGAAGNGRHAGFLRGVACGSIGGCLDSHVSERRVQPQTPARCKHQLLPPSRACDCPRPTRTSTCEGSTESSFKLESKTSSSAASRKAWVLHWYGVYLLIIDYHPSHLIRPKHPSATKLAATAQTFSYGPPVCAALPPLPDPRFLGPRPVPRLGEGTMGPKAGLALDAIGQL